MDERQLFARAQASFAEWVGRTAIERGGRAVPYYEWLILLPPPESDGVEIRIRPLDVDSVMIQADWFIEFGADIVVEHEGDNARDLIQSIIEGRAVEHLAVLHGEAEALGWDIHLASGGSLGSRGDYAGGDLVVRKVPAW